MDTKLRSFSNHKLTKPILFLLIIAAFTMAMVQLQIGFDKRLDPESVFEPEYNKSMAFFEQIDTALHEVAQITYYHEELTNVPFYYYFNSGSKEYTNTGRKDRAYYEQFKRAFFYMEDGEWVSGKYSYKKTKLKHGLLSDYTAYVAFPDSYMDTKQQVWSQIRSELMPNAVLCLTGILLSLLLTVLSCIVTVCRMGTETRNLKKAEKVYSELLLLGLGFTVWLLIRGMSQILNDNISIGVKVGQYRWDIFRKYTATGAIRTLIICGIAILFCSLFLLLIHSLVRKLKAGSLIRDSIIYRLYHRMKQIYQYLCSDSLFQTDSFVKNLKYRQFIFIASTILSAAVIVFLITLRTWWFIIPLLLEVLVIIWYAKVSNSIYDRINKEIKEATQEQMKSERMKVELITNVSHDLKTPLTSIISFIDLLSKENNLSEGAKDYIRILQDKSERLKNIVMDLFDLAKSTSGAVKLEYDYIDLGKLIRQTLADLDDRIQASGLTFKCNLPENPIQIYADGNKLYRVFLNIIDNALKYAMRQTRVYIELSKDNERAVVSVKNIASYDMNFTAQEILQRFTRGDQARTSEGSGLGLSIAESFTKVCGGDFRVEVEGDMFKVYLSFEQAENPKQDVEAENTPIEQH